MEYRCTYYKIDFPATGQKLSTLISQNGYTVRDISNMLGVSLQSVYKWMHGKSLPSLENMLQLSRLLGVSMESILVESKNISYRLPEHYVREERLQKWSVCNMIIEHSEVILDEKKGSI